MNRRKKKRPPRYVRQDTEKTLSDFLRELGWEHTQSPMLDHVHKIDLLVSRFKPLSGSLLHPIGLQVTQKRGDRKKIATFFAQSPAGTQGPLLYAEIHGKVTLKTAIGLTSAMLALWLDSAKRRTREYLVHITSSGTFWWEDASPYRKRDP